MISRQHIEQYTLSLKAQQNDSLLDNVGNMSSSYKISSLEGFFNEGPVISLEVESIGDSIDDVTSLFNLGYVIIPRNGKYHIIRQDRRTIDIIEAVAYRLFLQYSRALRDRGYELTVSKSFGHHITDTLGIHNPFTDDIAAFFNDMLPEDSATSDLCDDSVDAAGIVYSYFHNDEDIPLMNAMNTHQLMGRVVLYRGGGRIDVKSHLMKHKVLVLLGDRIINPDMSFTRAGCEAIKRIKYAHDMHDILFRSVNN
uniref:Uncharacterized protein n=1 Tax=viral metagenome TaxID=1070528 RepID=A0A6C0BK58_9ZZZZ